jgi:hypothetical protein
MDGYTLTEKMRKARRRERLTGRQIQVPNATCL